MWLTLFWMNSPGWAEDFQVLSYGGMDQNGDGSVSKMEFQDKAFQHAFESTDTNNDGKIDYSEWQQYDSSPESKKHFDALDQDRNSDLSLLEFKDGRFSFLNPVKVLNGSSKPAVGDTAKSPDQIFQELDNDQNNLLTQEEVPSNGGVKLVSFKF